ncbi:MAG: LytR/AlgR family response regulator transcription factor [Tenuifilaceae bacterium]
MVKLAIVEDEEEILEATLKIINDYCPFVAVCGTASDIGSARELLQNSNPDIALLDINLPEGNSFDVLKSIVNINFKIIFLTAHEGYALQAIKFSAIDYLMKPINPTELISALHQAAKTIEEQNNKQMFNVLLQNLGESSRENKVIVLKTSESIHIVEVRDIIRCESDSSYTTFYLNNGQRILISKSLKEYDEMLSSFNFFRVHQSHLVNMRFVKKFDKTDGGFIVMSDGSNVPVSTRKKEALIHSIELLASK